MDKKTSKVSKVAACVLLIVNFISMVSCLIIFGFSLWVIISPVSLSSAIEATKSSTLKALIPQDSLSLHLGVGVSGLAIFIFFISLMGFYGAITRSPFQLFMYSSLVLLLMLLECALLYYFSSNLVEKGVQSEDGQWAHAARLAFSCCERNSSFPDSNQRPWSCCGAATISNCTGQEAFKKDCQSALQNWLDTYQTAIYLSVIILHVVLSSCSLIRRSGASRSHT